MMIVAESHISQNHSHMFTKKATNFNCRLTEWRGSVLAPVPLDSGDLLLQTASSSFGNVTSPSKIKICQNFICAFVRRASYVSVLTIVSFSTERYLSICYPLYLYTMSGLQRAVRIITCLWIVAFFSALPFSMYTNVNYLKHPVTDENIEVRMIRISTR